MTPRFEFCGSCRKSKFFVSMIHPLRYWKTKYWSRTDHYYQKIERLIHSRCAYLRLFIRTTNLSLRFLKLAHVQPSNPRFSNKVPEPLWFRIIRLIMLPAGGGRNVLIFSSCCITYLVFIRGEEVSTTTLFCDTDDRQIMGHRVHPFHFQWSLWTTNPAREQNETERKLQTETLL